MKLGSLTPVVQALQKGVRVRIHMVLDLPCIEVYGAGTGSFVCSKANGTGNKYCEQVREFIASADGNPLREWLSVAGNSVKLSFEQGEFSVIKYEHGRTAALGASVVDIDTAFDGVFRDSRPVTPPRMFPVPQM